MGQRAIEKEVREISLLVIMPSQTMRSPRGGEGMGGKRERESA